MDSTDCLGSDKINEIHELVATKEHTGPEVWASSIPDVNLPESVESAVLVKHVPPLARVEGAEESISGDLGVRIEVLECEWHELEVVALLSGGGTPVKSPFCC